MTIANRIIQLDLDIMCDNGTYDHSALEHYITRCLKETGVTAVYVQVGSENFSTLGSDRDRTADALLFDPGPALDAKVLCPGIFNAAVSIIRGLLPSCRILAWAPTLYSAFLMKNNSAVKATASSDEEDAVWYRRASPFSALTHTRLVAFYEALGRCSEALDGVMYQDDLLLSNWEDVSTDGLKALVVRYGLRDTSDDALTDFLNDDDNEQNQDWKRYKTAVLDTLSSEMFEAFKRGYQQAFPERFAERESKPETRLIWGRDYYDDAVLARDHVTGEWYGQNLDTALNLYDHVVIMAYYNMSRGGNPAVAGATRWLRKLAREAIAVANSEGRQRSGRLIFKLQSVLWRDGGDVAIPAATLKKQVRVLQAAGATGIGFYPALDKASLFDMSAL